MTLTCFDPALDNDGFSRDSFGPIELRSQKQLFPQMVVQRQMLLSCFSHGQMAAPRLRIQKVWCTQTRPTSSKAMTQTFCTEKLCSHCTQPDSPPLHSAQQSPLLRVLSAPDTAAADRPPCAAPHAHAPVAASVASVWARKKRCVCVCACVRA
eukprot:1142355-Pelagomonas_calceolata.AAC.10